MVDLYNFYIDDSGTRHPDRQLDLEDPKPDWFALGGILVRAEDEEQCRAMHKEFCERWEIQRPLHSHEIRHQKKNFHWLRGKSPEQRNEFMTDITDMLLNLPVAGMACVVDRRGYHRRYHEKYGDNKWSLCRSAFAISVERAGKFARAEGRKLSVFVERSDKITDNQTKEYFGELKEAGHPFDEKNASKYGPLDRAEMTDTLYDFKLKTKTSPMMQIADLYLYPICLRGYNPQYLPCIKLEEAQRLIDCHVEDRMKLGIKYYCFEQNPPQTTTKD